MGQLWYIPSVKAEEFDDSVFSDIEKGILNCLIDWILIKINITYLRERGKIFL